MSETTTTPAQADALPVVESPVVETAAAPDAVATPAPSDAAQETEDKTPAKDPATGRFVKRTEQFQAQISTLRAEKGALEREVAQLEKRKTAIEKEASQQQPVDPNDFAAADAARLNKVFVDNKLKDLDQNIQEARQRKYEVAVAAFNHRIDIARERVPDIDQAVAKLGALSPAPTLAREIVESDKAPELVLHFNRHPNEVARISRLPEIEQAREIGRLEASLSAPSPKRISTAPAPLQTASGGATSPAIDPEKMSQADYVKWRTSQA